MSASIDDGDTDDDDSDGPNGGKYKLQEELWRRFSDTIFTILNRFFHCKF